MQTVTISSKYQIVIPKEVREKAGLRPGAPLEVLC
jgi:AbrB family looped-hinge helix DNA binding protein